MHFKAQSLTVLSRLLNAQNKLQLNLIVPPTCADGELTSPLMLNDMHLIADSTLNVKFSPIMFNLNLEQVSLLINVSMSYFYPNSFCFILIFFDVELIRGYFKCSTFSCVLAIYSLENQNLSKDFNMDLTELNAVRFVTGSKPKIDPRVLIAQNVNEWVYNHVLINVDELSINMPTKEIVNEERNSAIDQEVKSLFSDSRKGREERTSFSSDSEAEELSESIDYSLLDKDGMPLFFIFF